MIIKHDTNTITIRRVERHVDIVHRTKTVSVHDGGRRGLKGDPGADGRIYEVHQGAGIIVDNTDPANPIISASGGSGDKNFTSEFTMASLLSVGHDLQKYPSVSVVNSAGDEVVGDIKYLDINNLTVTFTAPFSGRISCN